MFATPLLACFSKQHSRLFFYIQKPIKERIIGVSMSIQPNMRAHQGRSSGFWNSAKKLTEKEISMMISRPYRTIQKRIFGKRSPVALNII